jgi:hypothetical protein
MPAFYASFCTLMLSAALTAADDIKFSKFTVVDMRYSTEMKTGDVVKENIRRFVIKEAKVVNMGEKSFITGTTPVDNKIDIQGSNWAMIMIPIDRVIALVGVDAPPDLIARPGVLNGDVGYKLGN